MVNQSQLLVFELDEMRFALPLGLVKEVHRAVEITPLPKQMEVVEGIVNLRGDIVPVYDVRARFSLPPRKVQPSDHLIIAEVAQALVALRVDRVTDLETVTDESIDETRHIEHVAGVAKLEDGMVMIQNLATFLSLTERRELRALLAAKEIP